MDVCVVTPLNVSRIADRLKVEGGTIVIAPAYDQAPLCLPIHIELFVRPKLRLQAKRIDAMQRDPNLLDRSYRLHVNRHDPMMNIFESRKVGNNFLFTIGYQAISSREFMAKGDRTLYVPDKAGLPHAFRFVFTELPFARAMGISVEEAEQLIPYMLEDLKTHSVVKKNMAAGQKADDILFS